ncbi:MAG: ABC transporter substrate-binding protein [Myxococcota bacterium]
MQNGPPARVVSLAPAISQVALRVRPDVLVGYDQYSERQLRREGVANVGDMRALSAEPILALEPTIVLHNGGARPPEVLERVESAGVTVMQIPHERSLDGVRTLIRATGKAVEGNTDEVVAGFDASCAKLPSPPSPRPRGLFVYVRSGGAMSVAGTGTAAHAMMTLAGVDNVLRDQEGYAPLTAEASTRARPDWVLFTTHGLERAGGPAGVAQVPGLAELDAVREGQVASIEDVQLLSFGLDTCAGVRALADAVHGRP